MFPEILQSVLRNVTRENWPCPQALTTIKFVPYHLRMKSSELASLKTEMFHSLHTYKTILASLEQSETVFLLQFLYLNTRSASEVPFQPGKRNVASSLWRVQHGIDAATCFLFVRLVTYPNLPETDTLFEDVSRFVVSHVEVAMRLLHILPNFPLGAHSNLTEEEVDRLHLSLRLLIKVLVRVVQMHGSVTEGLLKGLIKAMCPFVSTSAESLKLGDVGFNGLRSILKINLLVTVPAAGLEMFIVQLLYEQAVAKDDEERMSQEKKFLAAEDKVESFLFVLISLLQKQAEDIIELTEDKVSVKEKIQLFRSSILKFATAIYETCLKRPLVTDDVHIVLSKLLETASEPERPGAVFLVLALGDLLARNLNSRVADKFTFTLVNLAAILESMRNLECVCHQYSSDIQTLLERALKRNHLNLSCTLEDTAAVRRALKGLLSDHWKAERKENIWACLMLYGDENEELPSFTQEPLLSTDGILREQHYCNLAFSKWFTMLSSFKERQNSWFNLLASFISSWHVDTCTLALRTVGKLAALFYPEWFVRTHGIGFQTLLRDALTETNVTVQLAAIDVLSDAILHSKTDLIWRNMGDALVTCLTYPHKDVKQAAVLALRKVCLGNPDWPYVHTALWEILMGLESEPSCPKVDQAIVDLFRQRWFTSVSADVKEKGTCICYVLESKTCDIRRFMDDFEPGKHQIYLRLLFTKLFEPKKGRKSSVGHLRYVSETFIKLWTRNPLWVQGLENFLVAWAQTAPEMIEQLLDGFFAYLREHYWPILEAADEEQLLKAWEAEAELLFSFLAVMSSVLPRLATRHLFAADWLQLENLLVFYITCEEVEVAEQLVQCWHAVVQYATKDFSKVSEVVQSYYRMVVKYVNTVAVEESSSERTTKVATFQKMFVHRVLTLGLVGLYFGFEAFDKMEGVNGEAAIASPLSIRLGCVLTKFIEDSYDHFDRKQYDCRLAAMHGLKSLGYVTARYDEYLVRGFLHKFYKQHLHDVYFRVDVFYRVLQNLSLQWRRPGEWSMSRICAVMKCYVVEIKESLLCPVEEIRREAFNLVCCAFLAKINDYETCVPYLVALSSNADLDTKKNAMTGGWESSLPRLAMKWMKRAVTVEKTLSYSEGILLTTYKYQSRLQKGEVVSGVRGQKSLLEEFYVSLQGVESKCKFLREALRVWTSHRMDLKFLNFVAGALAHLPQRHRGEVEVLFRTAQGEAKNIAGEAVKDMNRRSVDLADESGDFSTCEEILRGFQASILLVELLKYLKTEYDVENVSGRVSEKMFRKKSKVFHPTVIINDLQSQEKCNRQLIISRYRECRKFM